MPETTKKPRRRRLSAEKVAAILSAQRRVAEAQNAARDAGMPDTFKALLVAANECDAEVAQLLGAAPRGGE